MDHVACWTSNTESSAKRAAPGPIVAASMCVQPGARMHQFAVSDALWTELHIALSRRANTHQSEAVLCSAGDFVPDIPLPFHPFQILCTVS